MDQSRDGPGKERTTPVGRKSTDWVIEAGQLLTLKKRSRDKIRHLVWEQRNCCCVLCKLAAVQSEGEDRKEPPQGLLLARLVLSLTIKFKRSQVVRNRANLNYNGKSSIQKLLPSLLFLGRCSVFSSFFRRSTRMVLMCTCRESGPWQSP